MMSQFICLSLVFQANADQTVRTDPNQSLNFWLVIAGIMIIFFCMLTVFVPRIKEFITKPQELNLSKLGISMKVSILTVFVLMGFVLSLSSFVLQWQGYVKRTADYQQEIIGLNVKLKSKEDEESRSRKFDMSILVKPDGNNEDLKSDLWSCKYQFETPSGEPDKEVDATVVRNRDGKSLRVFLKDVSADTRVFNITLFNKTNSKTWTVPSFTPLKDAEFLASKEGGPR